MLSFIFFPFSITKKGNRREQLFNRNSSSVNDQQSSLIWLILAFSSLLNLIINVEINRNKEALPGQLFPLSIIGEYGHSTQIKLMTQNYKSRKCQALDFRILDLIFSSIISAKNRHVMERSCRHCIWMCFVNS